MRQVTLGLAALAIVPLLASCQTTSDETATTTSSGTATTAAPAEADAAAPVVASTASAATQAGGQCAVTIAGGRRRARRQRIRTEQDLKGQWAVTDGASDCGCRLDFSSATNLQMKASNQESLKEGRGLQFAHR